jgi:hypothetical protein
MITAAKQLCRDKELLLRKNYISVSSTPSDGGEIQKHPHTIYNAE